ncbi:ESX secretion-associated protein EspG [Sciscionella sediminilitoris]|uniref:ESX secretion-associated protein EspG n=1 Tax=Sciscionella sediminilitoris TaxID=1445613 RepID=UPI0004DEF748|nr:ESX secretion-associated protein EspG [Sciscionella sp. SE31]
MLPGGRVVCHAEHFISLARHFQVGEPHSVLAGELLWRSQEAEEEQLAAALRAFGERGLLEDREHLDRDFAVSMGVLCHPDVAYYGWFRDTQDRWEILAAQRGQEAVCAVRCNGGLCLDQISPDALAKGFLAEWPAATAARFAPIRLSLTEFVEPPRAEDSVLVSNDYSETDDDRATVFALIRAGISTASAEAYVQVRDRAGRPQRSPYSLGYVAGRRGAWYNLFETDQLGDTHVICGPATEDALTEQLDRMRAELS